MEPVELEDHGTFATRTCHAPATPPAQLGLSSPTTPAGCAFLGQIRLRQAVRGGWRLAGRRIPATLRAACHIPPPASHIYFAHIPAKHTLRACRYDMNGFHPPQLPPATYRGGGEWLVLDTCLRRRGVDGDGMVVWLHSPHMPHKHLPSISTTACQHYCHFLHCDATAGTHACATLTHRKTPSSVQTRHNFTPLQSPSLFPLTHTCAHTAWPHATTWLPGRVFIQPPLRSLVRLPRLRAYAHNCLTPPRRC